MACTAASIHGIKVTINDIPEEQDMNGDAMDQGTATARRVHDYVATMKDQATQLKDRYIDTSLGAVGSYVKKNPGKTLLVSLAAGVLIGSLIRRR